MEKLIRRDEKRWRRKARIEGGMTRDGRGETERASQEETEEGGEPWWWWWWWLTPTRQVINNY